MAERAIPELHYRTAHPARGHFPGHHRSRQGSGGFEFRTHVPLHDSPDVRRLDLHASLRDPFSRWLVKLASEPKAIPVTVVADLSASMGFAAGDQRKLDVLANFVESLAWSAFRTGDSFGFVGCDETVRADFVQPQTRGRGVGTTLAVRLRTLPLAGHSARGLLEAHRHLPRQRALVFVVSDFHLPIADVRTVLARLSAHEVVPVVLWQPQEFALPAARGLVRLRDPESGGQRLVWWRPALRERWAKVLEDRREALLGAFRAQRLAPLFIEGRFDAEAVTRHFHA